MSAIDLDVHLYAAFSLPFNYLDHYSRRRTYLLGTKLSHPLLLALLDFVRHGGGRREWGGGESGESNDTG